MSGKLVRTGVWVCVVLLILGAVAVRGCRTHGPAREFASFVPHGSLQHEQGFGDYVVRIYRSTDDGKGSFEIRRNGSRVFAVHGYWFRVGSFGKGEEKMGADITGDGRPNLVVSEWTGGAHCCLHCFVFEIGERFRHIQTINAMDSGQAAFVNVDDDPALEFPMIDWTFAYWRTCFAASPAPRVVLKYQGLRYEPAPELMRETGFTREQMARAVGQIRSSQEWAGGRPPVLLWSSMLDLIYTGNMGQAWELARRSWPDAVEGRREFLMDFRARLRKSPFWGDIWVLNGGET